MLYTYFALFNILYFMNIIVIINCDNGDYSDTEVISMPHEYPSLTSYPNATLEIFTSFALLADTTDIINATFLGTFAVSGPHPINTDKNLTQGSRIRLNITLSRQIGELKSIYLENSGTDGWLLEEMKCRIDDFSYELQGKRQWLDSRLSDIQIQNIDGYNNDGFEPNQQEDIPMSPTLKWDTVQKTKLFSSTGPFNGHWT